MPLTDLQHRILALIGPIRTPESYVAGGTALHFSPNSTRFSRDLNLFHDALEAVAKAHAEATRVLGQAGYGIRTDSGGSTQIDWARDSAWRFMPVMHGDLGGYVLHDIDLATNKVLALAGRDEPRDFVDILFVMERILPLGPLIWASVAKDPGFSPSSLLEQIRRHGRHRPEEFDRLDLVRPIDLVAAKRTWLAALAEAETFIDSRPMSEAGCLYYRVAEARFVQPAAGAGLQEQGLVLHFGGAGGVLPRAADQ
jgi:hypothetical protein